MLRKYCETIGDGESSEFVITHNFDTRDIVVEVYNYLTGLTVAVDIGRSENSVKIWFSTPPKPGMYCVVIIG